MVIFLTVVLVAWYALPAGAQYSTGGSSNNMTSQKTHSKSMTHKGLLDGRRFNGTVGENGMQTGQTEDISFSKGMLHSNSPEFKGFQPAGYTATEDNGVITFKAESVSPTNGKLEWTGTVKGNTLDANLTWTREGKEPTQMWVKAERLAKRSSKMAAPAPTIKK